MVDGFRLEDSSSSFQFRRLAYWRLARGRLGLALVLTVRMATGVEVSLSLSHHCLAALLTLPRASRAGAHGEDRSHCWLAIQTL